MRIGITALVGALVVGFATTTSAQATLPKPTDPRDQTAAAFTGRLFGNVDFGGRFTSIDGDPARYERYRDLRDGPFAENFSFARRGEEWTLEVLADNVG